MGIAQIHAIKSTLKKAIDYITNEEKTVMENGTKLVSSFRCVPETAHIEFKLTENLANEVKGNYVKTGGANNLAYHLIQSFSVDDKDLTPEKAHQLGVQFAEEFLGGKFEYVIATHIDKGHLHNHIIFNATSYKDYKKFRSEPYKTVAKIREISDRICEENNLTVIKTKGVGKSYKEWQLNKEGKLTWKDTIKNKIDEIIPKVKSYDEFVKLMNEAGFTVKDNVKHIAFKTSDEKQERFIRGKRIGEEYTREGILKRIENTEKTNKKNRLIKIDKSNINKVLTDGFIVNVPNQDYLLYLDSKVANMNNDVIVANLTDDNYTIMNSGYTPMGSINAEQIFNSFSIKQNIDNVSEVFANENGELPLIDYIKLRSAEKSELIHKAAKAAVYSRTENIIYYSDYKKRLSELKDKEYETRHLLINLDKKAEEIKNIGKLLITYNKNLPYRKELEKLRFAKFTKQKFMNKHQYDLASLDYAEAELIRLGVDIENINQELIVNQIKDNNSSIAKLENEAHKVNERIEKICEAQSVIDEFISSNKSSELQPIRSNSHNKTDVEL